jgi:hypothetical protein
MRDVSVKPLIFGVLVCAMAAVSPVSHATSVSPGGVGTVGILTDLGTFNAGMYTLTGSGIVDLVGNGSFRMRPDGLPETTVTAPGYGAFNPNGSFTADGSFGAAGLNAKVGALIGTLSATPASPADWFLIGFSTTVTLTAAGHIYASVNDTFHNNNTGSFEVNVAAAVPEPETYAMLLAGLGLLGFAARRKRSSPC